MSKKYVLALFVALLSLALPILAIAGFSQNTPAQGYEYEEDEYLDVGFYFEKGSIPSSSLYFEVREDALVDLEYFPFDVLKADSDGGFMLADRISPDYESLNLYEGSILLKDSLSFNVDKIDSIGFKLAECSDGDLVFSYGSSLFAVCEGNDLNVSSKDESAVLSGATDQWIFISLNENDVLLERPKDSSVYQFKMQKKSNFCFSGQCESAYSNHLVLDNSIFLFDDAVSKSDFIQVVEDFEDFEVSRDGLFFERSLSFSGDSSDLSLNFDGDLNQRTYFLKSSPAPPEPIKPLSWIQNILVPGSVNQGESVNFNLREYIEGGNLSALEIVSLNDLFSVSVSGDDNLVFEIDTSGATDGLHDVALNVSDGQSFAVSNEFILEVNEESFISRVDSSPVNSSLDYIFADFDYSSHYNLLGMRLLDEGGPVSEFIEADFFMFDDLSPANYSLVVEVEGPEGLQDLVYNYTLYSPVTRVGDFRVSDFTWEDDILALNISSFSEVFKGGVPGALNVSLRGSSNPHYMVRNSSGVFLVRYDDYHVNSSVSFFAFDGFTDASSNSFWLNSSLDGAFERKNLDDLGNSLQWAGIYSIPSGLFNVSTKLALSDVEFESVGARDDVIINIARISPRAFGLDSEEPNVFQSFVFESSLESSDLFISRGWLAVPGSWFVNNSLNSESLQVYAKDDLTNSLPLTLSGSNDTHFLYEVRGIEGDFLIGAGPFDVDSDDDLGGSGGGFNDEDNAGNDFDNLEDDTGQSEESEDDVAFEDANTEESESNLVLGVLVGLLLVLLMGGGVYYYYYFVRVNNSAPVHSISSSAGVGPVAKISALGRKVDGAVKSGNFSMASGLIDEMKAEALKVSDKESAMRKMLFDKVKSYEKKVSSYNK